ncbi:MAG: aspartate--tRNA ligase [Oscillospiraceae bacterium]|jgi:aspartyl-tRNA synthetase|nr:aspartate--tRNA ligase [Oscillospiraceae bacterium]
MYEPLGELRRSKYCGELRAGDAGKEMTLCGFVQRQRVLSNLIFIVLRDRSGIAQLAFDDKSDPEIFAKAQSVRSEYILAAKGIVRKRESINAKIPSGEVELYVSELKILSAAKTPPFEIRDDVQSNDELRLKYRYLDLRRPVIQNKLIFRHQLAKAARDYYDQNGFIEVETPVLIKSTPEGARDYLVPSRVFPGEFYSLPQSPQLYKQILMAAGFDKYIQIAKCFRDEDLRADRQPEFTQIDTEMSFVGEDDVIAVTEGFIKYAYKKLLDKDVQTPFRRMAFDEAMERYGCDKPDTRFGLELVDLSGALAKTKFKAFASALETGGVKAINAKGLAQKLSRKEIDRLVEFAKSCGAGGLAYTRFAGGAVSSSYEKFLTEGEIGAVRSLVQAEEGDVVLIVADANKKTVSTVLSALRSELGGRFGLYDPSEPDILWIVDCPLFEYDEEEKRYVAAHHPFTAPKDSDAGMLETNPGAVKAKAYDIIINGYETGGGSIRINDPELQSRMFRAIGFTEEEAREQFGFLLEAFKYGAPPHGGFAFGLDRLVMVMTGTENIRDVIAFPKLQNAREPMSGAPSPVARKQLDELYLYVKK